MARKKSLRADKTPPRKTKNIKQMVDIKGFPLTTEQGAPLVTEKDAYRKSEYGEDVSPSVVLNSESYKNTGKSLANVFSKANPAALPVVEKFSEQSEVSRSLLGINRETAQQGLFGNVSSYGLDPKDWRIDSVASGEIGWWTIRPSSAGNYYPVVFSEDARNSSIVLSANPTPFLEPPRPGVQDQLINSDGADRYTTWGQYINGVVALYLFRYMVNNFTPAEWEDFNLLPMLRKYPPIDNGDGTYSFNELYWDKLWLDIQQLRFGSSDNYPIIPNGKAFNFNTTQIQNWRSTASLWGSSNVIISEANANLPGVLDVSWDKFFFGTTRMYYPEGRSEDQGHFRIKTNPVPSLWEKYHGLRWEELRQDLKDWEFTVHKNASTITQVETDLKLPYFLLDSPLIADRENNTFTNTWPSQAFGAQINLPTNGNRIGGTQGISAEITLKSIRAFRYQPGRISGFTYGVKVSEIGAGPGTIIEFGAENETDSYMFRLSNGALFSIVRRSTLPLESTEFLDQANYAANTETIVRNGKVQYETVIEQKIMNGDSLSGEGETGYLINPDTVTMYKIEFGWYGAIGARFYAYVPVENNECRWVTMHTLVIENQLGKPCLADPFFHFKYRLKIEDSSAIRVDQYIDKFGASYYIDGYDEGTLYNFNAQSKVRSLANPGFSQSKTQLNAIDWTTVLGIKPRQFLTNRGGIELYNKKEIFPKTLSVHSQQDCEVKIIRQRGCPEWAYSHQEGYVWNFLPEERRLKGKFNISRYYALDFPGLGILENTPQTHTAVMAYSQPSTGDFRNPTIEANWDVIGDQVIRIVGDDLFALFPNPVKDFSTSNTVALKLQRDSQDLDIFSSRKPTPIGGKVYLPFTYAPVAPYESGYDVEFDYFRRDQILLSTTDVLSSEFYIYWVGGGFNGIDGDHASSLRVGFVWPNTTTPSDPLYATSSNINWGVETNALYDGEVFYEGLPYDFAFDYSQNSMYVETSPTVITDTYNLEIGEFKDLQFGSIDNANNSLGVPGIEGGSCKGLFCKAGRELRENVTIISEEDPNTPGVVTYYINDPSNPWPNLGDETFIVTIAQGAITANRETSGGITKTSGDVTQYLLPIGTSLPTGISLGSVNVFYNIVYIATINRKSETLQILVSKIAPGNIPFIRVFLQGRQGTAIGGVWIGQKTADGVRIEPFTPHRCTVSISDGQTDYHSEWSSLPQLDGPSKVISSYTQLDAFGASTAPTINASENSLNTYKSIHTSPKKCGSFLSPGGTNSAGIFTTSTYPLRWLTSNEGSALATYYISADTPTSIDLTSIFNVFAESVVNEDDGNLATFFVARSLSNHDGNNNEIYLSLDYSEQ
jgi:hypothetical protein